MIANIVLTALVFLIIGGLLAPIEALSWWAKSGPQSLAQVEQVKQLRPDPSRAKEAEDSKSFMVYISGIGVLAGDYLPPVELPMVQTLFDRLGRTTIITDVYPYSPDNVGLTQDRRTAWIWRRLARLKGTRGAGIAFLINIRNALQLMVSLDRRYGPVYNSGVALEIMKSLVNHGYDINHPKPVVLLGWSGGGQIAVAASWYLSALGVPCYVLSMAGILSSDPGLERVEHLWHLYGSKDRVHRSARFYFPERWKIFPNSAWNRALRAGKMSFIELGPAAHKGPQGYFAGSDEVEPGKTPFGMTAEAIIKLMVDHGFAVDQGSPNPAAVPPVVTQLNMTRKKETSL